MRKTSPLKEVFPFPEVLLISDYRPAPGWDGFFELIPIPFFTKKRGGDFTCVLKKIK